MNSITSLCNSERDGHKTIQHHVIFIAENNYYETKTITTILPSVLIQA